MFGERRRESGQGRLGRRCRQGLGPQRRGLLHGHHQALLLAVGRSRERECSRARGWHEAFRPCHDSAARLASSGSSPCRPNPRGLPGRAAALPCLGQSRQHASAVGRSSGHEVCIGQARPFDALSGRRPSFALRAARGAPRHPAALEAFPPLQGWRAATRRAARSQPRLVRPLIVTGRLSRGDVARRAILGWKTTSCRLSAAPGARTPQGPSLGCGAGPLLPHCTCPGAGLRAKDVPLAQTVHRSHPSACPCNPATLKGAKSVMGATCLGSHP